MYRKVELTKNAKDRGVTSSTFWKDNLSYTVRSGESTSVREEVASAWASADTNVQVMKEI